MSISVDNTANERWRDLRRLTDRPSVFAHPQFEPGVQVFIIISSFQNI